MGIETLNAMNEGMQASLMMIIEIMALIAVLFAIAGTAIYLAGVAWLCFEESGSRRRTGHSQQGATSRSARYLPLVASLTKTGYDRLD
jgi:hypothetical protein